MDRLLELAEQYQLELAIVGGIIVVLVLAWLAWSAWRRRRRERHVERPTGTVRRPIYLDADLLDDLRAHGDPNRSGSVPATTAQAASASPRTEDTRRLNDTLASLEGSDVLIDLDADPDHGLSPGKAVVLTGTLHRHPATDAAEILELSAPLLQRAGGNGHATADGDTDTMAQVRADEITTDHAPFVVTLEHPSARHGHLLVLPRAHLRADDPTRAGRVTVIAVVDRVLGRRDTLAPEDYLAPHLSTQGRGLLADRDLTETVTALSDVAREDLGARDLPFKGPGTLLTPAAIHR
jgi:hypothetical protein